MIATKDEAPPDKSWINTIWDAPPKIIKDVAYVINGEKPIAEISNEISGFIEGIKGWL